MDMNFLVDSDCLGRSVGRSVVLYIVVHSYCDPRYNSNDIRDIASLVHLS